MFFRLIKTILPLLLLFVLQDSNVAAGSWFEQQTIEHDGLTRYYRYYVPDVLPPGGYSLLFVLHGGGGDYESFLNNGTHAEWTEIADEDGILLVVPNGVNRDTGDTSGADQSWNDCRSDLIIPDTTADDIGFFSELIDWSLLNHPIDEQRIYSTGSSNGGMMSYRVAFELGDRVAAIASFIANLPAASECRPPSSPIPVFISNGDAETTYMPWDGGCVVNCNRGSVISAEATREFWIEHNRVDPLQTEHIDHPDLDPAEGVTAESDLYIGGYEGTEVMFYRMRGGGHVTPSIDHVRSPVVLQLLGLGRQCHDVEGSREAWAFLSRHRLDDNGTGSAPGSSGLLRIGKELDGSLRLNFAGDCGSSERYGIYRGDLLSGYGSIAAEPGFCSLATTVTTLPAGSGTADFFLVVPNDGSFEGSYGTDSDGTPRAAATAPCRIQADPLDLCTSR